VVIEGKCVSVSLRLIVEGANPPRRQPSQRFVHICCHSGRLGHIRRYCLMLRFRAPKKETTLPRTDIENLVSMMRSIVLRLDKLDGGMTVPRRRRNRSKKVEIIHPLRGSDKRTNYLGYVVCVCLGVSFMYFSCILRNAFLFCLHAYHFVLLVL
jgi:hypothetical protein